MWLLSTFMLFLSIHIVKSTVDYLQHPVKSCHIGDLVENECNKCLCTSKTVFECTSLDCNRNTTNSEIEATKPLCHPNQLYVQNLITCICTKDGRWPHKSCHETFNSLPPSKVISRKCEPDTYVPIDCNICRCGPDGEIINDRCTRNVCEDDAQRRAYFRSNSVYSNCEMKNWYSLAPCQFCFCVHQNKLVCNTGNYYSKKLELGSYNLRVCGKDLIREAIELIPDNQRTLRVGLNLETTTPTPRAETSTVSKGFAHDIHENHNFAIEVNRESNENKTRFDPLIKLGNMSSSNEYYSDSEEEPPTTQKKPAQVKSTVTTTVTSTVKTTLTEYSKFKDLSTMFPFEEGDEMLNESEVKSEEDNDEDSSELEVEQTPTPLKIVAPLPAVPDKIGMEQVVKAQGTNSEEYQYVGNTLKINLPKVLNKVFQLALRKSMVSLTNATKCIPGETSVHDCNMCFCLKNSKLLCTNNKCKEGKKV